MAELKKQLSVVLGTYNRLRFLKLTVDSIRRELDLCPFSHEIVVVDGGSTDGTLKWLARQKDIITIVQHNRGTWKGKSIERRSWGYFMNLGFKCAQGKFVCMLSDDCLVVPGAIVNGYTRFEEELQKGIRVGAVAFYWRNWPEQKEYWVGITFGNKMFVNHGMYLKHALESVGYIDEDSFFFYYADSDLCLRMAQAGYDCIDSPDSYIEHFPHTNGRIVNYTADLKKHSDKWEALLGRPGKDWITKEYYDPHCSWKLFKWRWFL